MITSLWRIIVILCFIVVGPVLAGQGDGKQDDGIDQIISQFIAEEFAGEPDVRQRLAMFSAERDESIEARLHPSYLSGVIISLSASPLVVVSKYEIKETKMMGNRAIASVTFDVIGRTERRGLPGRRLFATSNVKESVQYEMCRNNGKWFVFNPPLPRVSKMSLLSHYEGALRSMEDTIKDSRASQAQEQVYEKIKRDLDLIRTF